MQAGQLVEPNQKKFGKFEKLCNHTKTNTVAFMLCGKGSYFLRFAYSYFPSAYHVQAFSIPMF